MDEFGSIDCPNWLDFNEENYNQRYSEELRSCFFF